MPPMPSQPMSWSTSSPISWPKRLVRLAALAAMALPLAAAAQAPCCGPYPAGPPSFYRVPPLRPACGPAPCGVGFVSGYLPRNVNVPIYNEPPTRGPRW